MAVNEAALIIAGLALAVVSAFAQTLQAFATVSDNDVGDTNALWYVGKGARENMHFKYQIEHIDTNNGRPFNLTISLVEFNTTGKFWIARVSVEDQGQILNGTVHLHNSDMRILNSSSVPSTLLAYEDGYELTLAWLSFFTLREHPLSLDARIWGKIGSLGGPSINNLGTERVTVPAGTFDTTVMGGGDRLKIWINKDLPYPVKASHFDRLSENATLSIFAKFELLEVGGSAYVPVNIQQDNSVVAEDWSSVQKGPSFPLIIGIGAAIAGIVAFLTLSKRK